MSISSAIWEIADFPQLDNGFFRPQEKRQLQTAYKNFLSNTKIRDEQNNSQMLLQSKLQLFQLFVRTQPVNIRSFSVFQQEKQRVFIERLFYLFLNNVALTTQFSNSNVNSIIHISKELEKYQRSTHKTILNTGKLNTVIQFVLSFSSSSICSFQLNNLFYLLLNDMNDFSGKMIDRIAELLRSYHWMTYGHGISKQYLISTVDHAISTINFLNPSIYPLYENFLNSSFVYKGPISLTLGKSSMSISLLTIIQNLSFALLGIDLDDFEREEKFLFLTADQCYHVRLIVRHLTFLFKHYHYSIEYPLNNLDKQILIHLFNLIVFYDRTSPMLKELLNFYLKSVHGFSQSKVKHLLYDLLLNSSLEFYAIETIGHLIEFNRFQAKILLTENKNPEDDLWLNDEQIRLVTHRFYSEEIYRTIFLPIINGNGQQHRTINEILIFFEEHLDNEDQTVIDVQMMKEKFILDS